MNLKNKLGENETNLDVLKNEIERLNQTIIDNYINYTDKLKDLENENIQLNVEIKTLTDTIKSQTNKKSH